MAAAENHNDRRTALVRVRCFPQPRLTPSVDGSGTDLLLEITGEGVDKITESTPHLWTSTAAGVATAHVVKLHFLFGRRLCCPRGSMAAIEDLLRDVTIFQVTLEDACWERIFTEYLTCGLFDSTYSTDKAICEAVRTTHLASPNTLILSAVDLKIVDEPLNIPGTDGRPARGRAGQAGYRAAVAGSPAVQAAAVLQYLGLCKLSNLFSEQQSPLEPALPWCLLSGLLGDYYHRANRDDPRSSVRLGAEVLLHTIKRNPSYVEASDELLAGLVPGALLDNLLPFDLRDEFQWPTTARLELSDGASFTTGTDAQREAVESRRIHLVGTTRWAPVPRMPRITPPSLGPCGIAGALERAC